MKPFLILQLRPETEASDDEYAAFLAKGGLQAEDTVRVRLDCEDLPDTFDLTDYSGVIVGGGPGCVSDPPEKKSPVEARIEAAVLSLMPEITAQDFPFMGCCYGIGILTHHLGAEVSKKQYGEPVGTSHARIDNENTFHSSEALLRWHSEELGIISPAEFIPIAEESEAIIKIGRNFVIPKVSFVSKSS